MALFSADVQREYDRWCGECGPVDIYESPFSMGIKDVLRAHFMIVDFFLQDMGVGAVSTAGPRDINLLHSALYRQFSGFEDQPLWENTYQTCATLLYGLIKDHPFHDANKRTGFLTTLLFLEGKIGRLPNVPEQEFEDLMVQIASNEIRQRPRYRTLQARDNRETDVLFIADFLRRNTRPLLRQEPVITYRDLRRILHKWNYILDDPSGNHIVVYKEERRRKYLFVGPPLIERVRVGRIGYNGETKQVPKTVVKSVRSMCKLTFANDNVDNVSFYEGITPLNSLIASYAEPLRRLAVR